MRDTFSKLMTVAMVAGAALLVSACGGKETTTADTNTTEFSNSAEATMEGSTNDVTAVDAAGASDNVIVDNAGAPADTGNATADNATNAM